MFRNAFFTGLAALLMASSASATVIFGLYPDPPTIANTAANGVTSTRSGAGTFQIYALDTSSTDFGISSYSLTLTNTTAINHRSPNGTVNDMNGDVQTAGFSGLRSPTNANPVVASQGLPGSTPFLITGMGQSAGNLGAKALAIDPASSLNAGAVSASWGNYTDAALAPVGGHNWLFLAEGTYSGNKPTVADSVLSVVVATVYSNQQFSSAATDTMTQILGGSQLPNPPVVNPLDLTNTVLNATVSGTVTASNSPTSWSPALNSLGAPSYTPNYGAVGAIGAFASPLWNPATQAFSWNTTGSKRGDYVWNVSATNDGGTGGGTITVHQQAVPEPASLALLGLAAIGLVGFARRS